MSPTWIALIPILGGLVSQLIDFAEKLFTGRKVGAAKKKAVLESLASAWDKAAETGAFGKSLEGVTSKEVTPVASVLVDAMVGVANASGKFSHSGPIMEQPSLDAR